MIRSCLHSFITIPVSTQWKQVKQPCVPTQTFIHASLCGERENWFNNMFVKENFLLNKQSDTSEYIFLKCNFLTCWCSRSYKDPRWTCSKTSWRDWSSLAGQTPIRSKMCGWLILLKQLHSHVISSIIITYHRLDSSDSRILLSTSFLLSVFSLTVTLVRFHSLLVIKVDLPIKYEG